MLLVFALLLSCLVCMMVSQAYSVQRLTAVGFIRAVLTVELAVATLPVRDAEGGSAAQELTPTATARGGRERRDLGGCWSQRHRAISCCQRDTGYYCGDSICLFMFLCFSLRGCICLQQILTLLGYAYLL